jgi:hypothetical protein
LQVEHPTFKAACIARGLLQDDEEWRRCLQDASISATPHQLRDLFANILVFNDVADPLALWQEFKEDLAEDVLHHARQRNPEQTYDDSIFDKVSVGTGFVRASGIWVGGVDPDPMRGHCMKHTYDFAGFALASTIATWNAQATLRFPSPSAG